MLIKGGYTLWARQTFDSEIFYNKPDKWFKIWFFIVSKVNHKDNKDFKRGENLVTYSEISNRTKATKTQIYKTIRWAKKERMIDANKTTRGFIIKVLNYGIFQDSENYTDDRQTTDRRQTDDRQTYTINNNDKKERNKEDIYKNKKTSKKESKTYTEKNLTLQEVADKILIVFNRIMETNFTNTKVFINNLEKCLENHTAEKIAEAIGQIKFDSFWSKAGTPERIFRQSKDGQPVDYIEQLLSLKKENLNGRTRQD